MFEINEKTIAERDMVQEYYYLSLTCADSQGVLNVVEQYAEAKKFSLHVKGLVIDIHIIINLADLVTDATWERVKPYRSGDIFGEAEFIIGMEVLKAELQHANQATLKMIAVESRKALTQGNNKKI